MLHIVHLEDDEPLRSIFSTALETFHPDLTLKQFGNSDHALNYIQQNITGIDLFVLDIRVAGSLDGMQLAERIRELGSPAPIVVTSAYQQPEKSTMDTLKCRWSRKPWHLTELMQELIPLAKRHKQSRVN